MLCRIQCQFTSNFHFLCWFVRLILFLWKPFWKKETGAHPLSNSFRFSFNHDFFLGMFIWQQPYRPYKSDRVNVIIISFCSFQNNKLSKCDDGNIFVSFHFEQIFTSRHGSANSGNPKVHPDPGPTSLTGHGMKTRRRWEKPLQRLHVLLRFNMAATSDRFLHLSQVIRTTTMVKCAYLLISLVSLLSSHTLADSKGE